MSNIEISDEYRELKSQFTKCAKRILKENISTIPETLHKYEKDIIEAYNNIILLIRNIYEELNADGQGFCIKELQYFREKLLKAFGRLESHIRLPESYLTTIDTNILTTSESESENELDLTIIPQTNIENLRENTLGTESLSQRN